jgi:hypothetical protein
VQQVGRRYVFGFAGRGFTNWSRAKQLLDKRIAERRAERGEGPMPHWTLHDLGRTVATTLVGARTRTQKVGHLEKIETLPAFALPHIVEAILNVSGHKASVASVYNHNKYVVETREALEKLGDYLVALVGAALSHAKSDTGENSGDVGGKLVSGT